MILGFLLLRSFFHALLNTVIEQVRVLLCTFIIIIFHVYSFWYIWNIEDSLFINISLKIKKLKLHTKKIIKCILNTWQYVYTQMECIQSKPRSLSAPSNQVTVWVCDLPIRLWFLFPGSCKPRPVAHRSGPYAGMPCDLSYLKKNKGSVWETTQNNGDGTSALII